MAAKGILIGRGYIAVDLDESGAKAALEALRKDYEKALSSIQKQQKVDVDTDSAKKKIDKFADDTIQTLGKIGRTTLLAGGILSGLGLGTSALQSASNGLLGIAEAAVQASGAALVLPAAFAGIAAVGVTAFLGMQNFFTAFSSNAKEAQQALDALAPAARDVVNTIRGLHLDTFNVGIQQNLFAGLSATVKQLATDYVPLLSHGFQTLATDMNLGARTFATWLQQKSNLIDFRTTFDEIHAALNNLIPAGTAVASIIRDLVTVGASFLPGLAQGFTNIAQKLADFVSQARQSGVLRQVMAEGLAVLKQLGDVIKNVAQGIQGVFRAASTEGGSFLTVLGVIAAQFNNWANSVQGQTALSQFFQSAKQATEALVPALKSAATVIGTIIAPELASIGQTIAPALNNLIKGIGIALQAAKPGLDAFVAGFKSLVDAVSNPATAQAVGNLISAVGPILGSVLRDLGSIVTNVVVPALNALSAVLQEFPGVFEFLSVGLIAGVLGWKAFSTAIDPVTNAVKGLKAVLTGSWAADASKGIEDVATKAGSLVEKFTGSSAAGGKLVDAGIALSGVMGDVASVVPLAGLAIGGLALGAQLAADHVAQLAQESKDIGQGLAVGGTAADDAAKKLANLQEQAYNAQKALSDLIAEQGKQGGGYNPYGNGTGATIGATLQQSQAFREAQQTANDAMQALKDYQLQLGPLGLAQARVSQAQKDYNKAVSDYGPNSTTAQLAQAALGRATDDLATAQKNASDATKSATQAIKDQADATLGAVNADLAYRQSKLDLQTAQQNYTQAVKDHGAASVEAQQAELSLEQSYVRSASAARDKAEADYKGADSAGKAAAGNDAYAQAVIGMALAAGKDAPPALLDMVAGLDASQLAAFNAQNATGNFHTEVLNLPGGKTVAIAVDDQGTPIINNVVNALNAVPKVVNIALHASSDVNSTIQSVLAYVPHAGGGGVQPGSFIKVGERGPEFMFADRSAYVATAEQSRRIADGVGGNAAANSGLTGNTINVYAQTDASPDSIAASVDSRLTHRARTF